MSNGKLLKKVLLLRC